MNIFQAFDISGCLNVLLGKIQTDNINQKIILTLIILTDSLCTTVLSQKRGLYLKSSEQVNNKSVNFLE
jgi:hypothetical protein